MSSQAQQEALLNDVALSLGALREAKIRFGDRFAPDFNLFDYLRSDEIGLSNCIAGLLDPKGSHGQGGALLNAFLTRIGRPDMIGSRQDWEVTTEKQANGMRRIDIFLRSNMAIIGIENKPWAGDQLKQLSDYASYLRGEAGNCKWLLIYLSDREPPTNSIDSTERTELMRDGQFLQCSYVDLISWLEECAGKTRAPTVRLFIEELAKFVRTRIRGELDMSEEKETTAAILKSKQNLEAAFDVARALEPAKRQLLHDFEGHLRTAASKAGLHLEWDKELTEGNKPCLGFGFKSHLEQDFYLRFEFITANRDGLEWGLCRSSDKVLSDSARWANVSRYMTDLYGSGKTSNWWPWYKSSTHQVFGRELRNWSNDPTPWLLILNGMDDGNTLASRTVDFASELHNKFGKTSGFMDAICGHRV